MRARRKTRLYQCFTCTERYRYAQQQIAANGSIASKRTYMEQLIMATPFGRRLIVETQGEQITASRWNDVDDRRAVTRKPQPGTLLHEASEQITAYLTRRLACFTLPLAFAGSEFEKSVWAATMTIPFGLRVSYGEVARAAGRPGAHRGVARAMATLNFALLVPAHRVVGADGKVKGAEPGSMRLRLLDFEANA